MKRVFSKLLYEMFDGCDTVLATIVAESGSTPRGIGAQMLVNAGGIVIGTIGGGAVEKETAERAKRLLREKKDIVHEYKLHRNAEEDIGMVCGGDVTVLMQFIAADDTAWKAAAETVLRRIEHREPGWLLLSGGAAPTLEETAAAIPDGVFALPLPIGERAIIFGAGHCGLALAPLLHTVGFRVTVMDDRAELVTKERYPLAEKCIVGDFTRLEDYLTITDEDYLVIMTNGHIHDFEVQEQVLRGKFAYVGVIGSRSKTATVNGKLREAGVPEDAIAKIHTPIGTAIKAVTPEEIAVSIAGEMILERAIRREKNNTFSKHCPMH